MIPTKRPSAKKQWFSTARKRIVSHSTGITILWLVSVFFAPVFFFAFDGAVDTNPNPAGSAGMAILTSFVAAAVITLVVQMVLAKRSLRRSF